MAKMWPAVVENDIAERGMEDDIDTDHAEFTGLWVDVEAPNEIPAEAVQQVPAASVTRDELHERKIDPLAAESPRI